MKEALVHIGHGKTGTSYIQSVLAINQSDLQDIGVIYPESSSSNSARDGEITSGNVSFRDVWPREVMASLRSIKEDSKVVFSSELIFHRFFDDLDALLELKDMCNLKILMFVRNPIEMAVSSYGQDIKRAGETCTPDEYIFKDIHLKKSLKILEFLSEHEINYAVYNYSRHRDDLVDVFRTEVGVPDKMSLLLPKSRVINRSLTRSEMALQKRLNEIMGKKSSKIFSDEMCQRAPDVPSELPTLSADSITRFRSQNSSMVDEVNSYLPNSEKISLEYSGDSRDHEYNDDIYSFSAQQLNVMAEVLYGQSRKNLTVEGMVDEIRDIALKMERTGSFSVNEVLSIMRIAHIFRPKGEFISQKIMEYEAMRAAQEASEPD
jgi:hypothetical protein